jgi:hypothetical protein
VGQNSLKPKSRGSKNLVQIRSSSTPTQVVHRQFLAESPTVSAACCRDVGTTFKNESGVPVVKFGSCII